MLCPSVGHRNCHSQPGRPRRSVSSSLTPQAALLVPNSGPIDPVVDRHGFTGVGKRPPCESRPGHLLPCRWHVWIVGECSYNVKQ